MSFTLQQALDVVHDIREQFPQVTVRMWEGREMGLDWKEGSYMLRVGRQEIGGPSLHIYGQYSYEEAMETLQVFAPSDSVQHFQREAEPLLRDYYHAALYGVAMEDPTWEESDGYARRMSNLAARTVELLPDLEKPEDRENPDAEYVPEAWDMV